MNGEVCCGQTAAGKAGNDNPMLPSAACFRPKQHRPSLFQQIIYSG